MDAKLQNLYTSGDQGLKYFLLCETQSNFGPVEETGEAVYVDDIQGMIPNDFPEGVYIRNGMELIKPVIIFWCFFYDIINV